MRLVGRYVAIVIDKIPSPAVAYNHKRFSVWSHQKQLKLQPRRWHIRACLA